MTDAQVANEQFLVLINDLLASGEVADLFPDDEIENILAGVRNEVSFSNLKILMFSIKICKKYIVSVSKKYFVTNSCWLKLSPAMFVILNFKQIYNFIQVKGAGLPDTREVCWKFFIDRVRKQLKVVLCFSPVGSTLRVRSRKFPALINCTSINWFHEWPQEALVSVAMRFLEELPSLPVSCKYMCCSKVWTMILMNSILQVTLRDSISRFMAYVHTSVNTISKSYLANERRYNYTTPKSYLEQITLYTKLVNQKIEELQAKIVR